MSKTLMMTTIAIALGGFALTAVPGASAYACAAGEPGNPVTAYVAHTCTYYVFGGEAREDVDSTIGYVVDETFGTIQFVWDTYGDDLP